MKKLLVILLVALVALFGVWRVLQYLAVPQLVSQQLQNPSRVPDAFQSMLRSPSPASPGESRGSVAWQVETVATGLQVPWSLVFVAEQTFLFTERPGAIRLYRDGQVQSEPVYTFPEVRSNQEQGLMGLALHPDYASNGWVYTCVSTPEGESYSVKIARLVAETPEQPTQLRWDQDVLTGIVGARVHAGCALVFGPDGKLYVSTGDATQRGLAKDPQSLVGKILRLNDDGSRPSDNPFADSLVFTTGHRNPQGLAWHRNGSLYSTEHGPSVFDGPAGGDELNRIVAGDFYGWPDVSHTEILEGARSPLRVFTPAEAPASLLAYSGKLFPQYSGHLFFGALRGTGLWRLELDPNDPDKIIAEEKLFEGEYGRIRNVTESPAGHIYFTTSNRDGRGQAGPQDDRILRLVPQE